jgi:5-methylcytosine-specific restriction endonuclease McrA
MPFASKAIRDRQRRRVAQRVRATGEPCCFCGQPISLALRYPDPFSFVVDHRQPTIHNGSDDYENLRPAHNRCNRIRSDHPDGTVGVNSGVLG